MKLERSTVLVVIFTCLLFMLAGTGTVAEEESGPEDIVIDNEGYKTDRKGPVDFSHLSHTEDYEVSCNECHHDYKEGKNVWTEGDPVSKCASCHNPLESKGNAKKLSIAFHKNCKTCHRNALKEGISEDAPFKSCYHCHKRKP